MTPSLRAKPKKQSMLLESSTATITIDKITCTVNKMSKCPHAGVSRLIPGRVRILIIIIIIIIIIMKKKNK